MSPFHSGQADVGVRVADVEQEDHGNVETADERSSTQMKRLRKPPENDATQQPILASALAPKAVPHLRSSAFICG
jgi:hypothetical protein